ncbi:hypothetical protein LRS03_11420 [Rhizobacter sp. J219]|jgi:hypothetical protein|uniref:hypothetical protein n=1 Tax=Rhizobacter sp. J219 TaxID=2898430 RepID=UPI0021514974|nr:hypothetical protein [Rhizobacter sp. J219]MCR5883435.1 hypothetical protein [Rhizobacter sp. J219]
MAMLLSRWCATLALAACGAAWATPDCPVTPFGDASPVQLEAGLSGRCQAESARWKVEAPRARPSDVGPSVMKAEFTSLTGLRVSSLLAAFRLDWSGLRGSEAAGSPKAERAAFAMGGLVKLHDRLALQTSIGLEHTGVQRSRATVSSVWQPSKLGVLFAEWAGSELGTEAHRVGGRWWIVPRRLSIDLGARRLPDVPGWVDPRVGLSLSLPL